MSHRGPLAIHATQRADSDACYDFGYDPKTIVRGAFVCIVVVKDCVQFPHPLAPPDDYGDFEPGRFGILMELIKKLEPPIPGKGHQGMFEWFWFLGEHIGVTREELRLFEKYALANRYRNL